MANSASEENLINPPGLVNSGWMRIVALLVAIVAGILTWLAVSGAVDSWRAESVPPAMSAKALPDLGIGNDARACYDRLERQQQTMLDEGIISADDMEAAREQIKAYCYTRN